MLYSNNNNNMGFEVVMHFQLQLALRKLGLILIKIVAERPLFLSILQSRNLAYISIDFFFLPAK